VAEANEHPPATAGGTDRITHEIDLIAGAKNLEKGGAPHRHVVFGYRLTGADLFRIDTDPQSRITTQYQDLIMREAIVEFGSLRPANGKRLSVPLSLLLDMDEVDRDDLNAGHNEFQALSLGDRESALWPPERLRLLFGFHIGEQTYDLVEFGRRLTGRDDVAADKQGLTGIARMCYRAGRMTSRVAISCTGCLGGGEVEHPFPPGYSGFLSETEPSIRPCSECKGTGRREGSEVDGPIDLEFFKTLDGADIQLLGAGAELWRQSFRLRGGSVPGAVSADSTAAGNEDRVDRGSDSGNATGAA
jgi:hypothetical protein